MRPGILYPQILLEFSKLHHLMSVMASFKEFCQTLLLYYDVDLISDEDFIILYEWFSSPKVKSLTFSQRKLHLTHVIAGRTTLLTQGMSCTIDLAPVSTTQRRQRRVEKSPCLSSLVSGLRRRSLASVSSLGYGYTKAAIAVTKSCLY